MQVLLKKISESRIFTFHFYDDVVTDDALDGVVTNENHGRMVRFNRGDGQKVSWNSFETTHVLLFVFP